MLKLNKLANNRDVDISPMHVTWKAGDGETFKTEVQTDHVLQSKH